MASHQGFEQCSDQAIAKRSPSSRQAVPPKLEHLPVQPSGRQAVAKRSPSGRPHTMLVYEGGKLNVGLSQTSDTLGFWSCFKADATAAGIREADYPSLLAALTTGVPKQLSNVEGGLKDFSETVAAIQQGR